MTLPAISVCPYLGLASEPSTARIEFDHEHRCFAQLPPVQPAQQVQETACLAGYEDCPIYRSAVKRRVPAPIDVVEPEKHEHDTGLRIRLVKGILPWAVLAVVVLAVVVVYATDLFGGAVPRLSVPALGVAATRTATPSPTLTPSPEPPTATALPSPAVVVPTVPATPTSEPGGRVLSLSPKAGDAGWFGSAEARGSHLGDSFLYAGYFEGQVLIATVRISLANVPRGAPIHEATFEMIGLNQDRFAPDAGGMWTVQLLAADALPNYSRAAFQDVLNAQSAVTLVPTLFAADLSVGKTNTWALDAGGRDWLAQQLLDGVDSVVARIVGPTGGGDTLFAWDSGSGPASSGEAPRLVLNLGAPPPTPPALPTEQVIVATLTPTPANVLTAAAYAFEATAQAGRATPLPYRIVTPTPPAENLATAQAYAAALGLPPLVVYTPAPANAATVEADAARATAVAVTTGTFTPVPTNAITPVILLPTDRPANAATVLAHALTATAAARQYGTPTPWPANVLIATLTPAPLRPTTTPANAETAVVRAAEATLTAVARGEPLVTDAAPQLTPTATPTRTPTPRAARARTPTPTRKP